MKFWRGLVWFWRALHWHEKMNLFFVLPSILITALLNMHTNHENQETYKASMAALTSANEILDRAEKSCPSMFMGKQMAERKLEIAEWTHQKK